MQSDKKYQVIYADPPWPEANGVYTMTMQRATQGGSYKDKPRFKTMSIKEICELPVGRFSDNNCVLFLWCTARHLPFSFEVIKAWGFNYVNIGFAWMKQNAKKGDPFFGVGAWTRQNVELCLLATKGKPYSLIKSHSVNQAVYEPVDKKTIRKPETVRKRIEQLLGDVPRLELFARQKTEGWDSWGNEVENDVEL